MRTRIPLFVAVALSACVGVHAAVAVPCLGDCSGDGLVTIDELIIGVNVALGAASATACPAFDCTSGSLPSIDCLVRAVGSALNGCPAMPTPTPTPRETKTYSVIGTVNGEFAQGELVLGASTAGLNTITFPVLSFSIGRISGSGTAEFFTLSNSLTITIDAQAAGRAGSPRRDTPVSI
jgi:hypothetical protein